jgi:hypothetical protein
MPKREKEELPPGHLDWYEDEGRKMAVGESMKIRRSQLRRLIREALLHEAKEGYMVPNFETTEDMQLFLDELEPEDTTMRDVVDPETGEVWLEAGYTPLEIGLVELEEEEQPEETDPDELDHYDWDHYDWDAHDREDEEREKAEEKEYERVVEKVQDEAVIAGKDWAMDTMYDAVNNPSMWQDQWSSPEDYVSGFGQDVTGDVADALLTYGDEDVMDMYSSLPREEQTGYYRDPHTNRPSQWIMKDIVADSVYTGIAQGIEEFKEKHQALVLPWEDLGVSA